MSSTYSKNPVLLVHGVTLPPKQTVMVDVELSDGTTVGGTIFNCVQEERHESC